MGLIARILEYARVTRDGGAEVPEVVADPGAGANLTSEFLLPPGDDSQPLPGDYVALFPIQRTGGHVAAGVLDTENKGEAGPGEKRLYARDSNGAIVATVWLKSDGAVEVENSSGSVKLAPSGAVDLENSAGSISLGSGGAVSLGNAAGSIEISAAGTVTINGVTIDILGNVSATEVSVGAINLSDHVHTGVTTGPGSTGGPTSPP